MIVTLLSDLGMRDVAVPVAKAALMQHVLAAEFVDISHCVGRDDVQQAAYLLLSAYRSFEKGTVHIVMVAIFGTEAPRMLMAKKDGYFFIVPDNGLLAMAFGNELDNIRLCFEYSKPYSFSEWMDNAGSVAATIEQGWVIPYRQTEARRMPVLRRYQETPYGLDCNVIYIDRYCNVVVDITKKQFEKIAAGRPFSIRIMKLPDITTISNQYNDVAEGQPLCRFNSAGYLEVAINHGDAASALGLDPQYGELKYKVVRVFF